MPIVDIVTGENAPVLRQQASVITVFDKELQSLVANLLDTMKDAQGVGLAAPQIGVSKRVLVAQIGGVPTPLVNPEILWSSETVVMGEEGCLSLPDVWLQIPRSDAIIVRFNDEMGEEKELKLEDFDARVVQHEVDHLFGKLIVDY